MLVFTRAVNAMMAKHWVELFCLIEIYRLWFKQDYSCARHEQVYVVLLNLLSVVSSIRDSFRPTQLQECYHESRSVCMAAADWDTCWKPEPADWLHLYQICPKANTDRTHPLTVRHFLKCSPWPLVELFGFNFLVTSVARGLEVFCPCIALTVTMLSNNLHLLSWVKIAYALK